MKKNRTNWHPGGRRCRKIEKIMKLGVLLMTLGCLSLSANSLAQRQRISLDLKDCTVMSLFQAIQQQTNLYFVYNQKNFAGIDKLNVQAKEEEVETLLNRLFQGQKIAFIFDDNTVIAKPLQPEQVSIQGRVVDRTKAPLPGVAIMIQGTTLGVTSDVDGHFKLTIPDKQPVILVFSFVGMKTKEVAWKGEKELNVTMEDEITEMEEVVVTGMFNKARESYTGAVTTIKSDDLVAYKGQNLISTLKNIDPSINILMDNSVGSNPNALPQMNMRGNSSLPMSVEEFNEGVRNQLNTPLIIMDGFEISLQKLMDYNDEEIASINILKDASATAIYGSRGANGVIVIVSKAPEAGHLKVMAQAGINIEIPDLSSYNLMNAEEKLELEYQTGLYTNTLSPTTDLKLKEQYQARLRDVLDGVDTYWLSKPLRTGVGQKYNLRLEGGSEEFRWGVSLAYNNIAGAMKDSQRNNFNGAITLTYNYKNVIFKNQTNVGLNKAYESKYGSFSDYANMNPYERPYNENGEINRTFYNVGQSKTIANPLYDAALNVRNESNYTELINNFSIEWSVTTDLKLRGQIGISKKTNMSDLFYPAEHSMFLTSAYTEGDGYFRRGQYTYGVGENHNYDGNVTLSYSKNFREKHQLYVGLDYSLAQSKTYNYKFVVEGLSNEDLDFIGNALQYKENGKPTGTENFSRRIGLTGNANYTYNNRYYVDFSYRIDGSSQFGSKNKFAPFWSTGIGWNLHREKFLAGQDVINTLRLKASYGQTGSQQFSAYQALSTYQYYSDKKYINWGGAALMGHGNENLKWQLTDQYNLGTEISAWNNRLTFSFDYYLKKTSNLLSQMDIPLATGFGSYVDNVGEVKNTGFETSLSGYVIRDTERKLIWLVSGKLVYNKNKITRLSDAIKQQTEEYKLQEVDVNNLFYEGYSQNSIYAVRSLGIDPSTGNEIFLDKDGNITDTWNPSAKVYLGVNEPTFRGNASTMFMYKNLSLNLSFGFHWGGKLYNETLIDKVEVLRSSVGERNLDKRVLEDRWSEAGDLVFFKKISNVKTHATSRFVMNDRVFELQTATLQYKWESDFLKKANIQNMTFGINMSDVFYLSSVKRERGTSYPFARRVGMTVSLLF